jgi:hypothetical protein
MERYISLFESKKILAYHGTNFKFDTFKKSKIGSATDLGDLGYGFYFSTDPTIGSNKKYIIKVNLKLQNPLLLKLPDFRTEKRNLIINYLNIKRDISSKEITKLVKQKGFDGIILDYSPTGYNHSEILIFEPNQIKIISEE